MYSLGLCPSARGIALWLSVCLAHIRPGVPSPAPKGVVINEKVKRM